MPRRQSLIGSPNTRVSFRAAPTRRSTRSSTRSSSSFGTRFSRMRRRVFGSRSSIAKALPAFSSAGPFPPTRGYRLVYEQDGALNVGTSGTIGSEQVFNLNSLYDPDKTGTGHQPYGYDALQVAYNRYKVHGCLVELEFYNIQTLKAIDCIYALFNPSNVSGTLTGSLPSAIGEEQQGEVVTIQEFGNTKRRVKMYVPMYKAFGMTKLQYSADIENTTAGVGGDPGSLATLHIGTADPNQGSSGLCRYKLKLTYFCQMYQRKIMAQS